MADLSTQLSTILIERHSAKPLAGEEYSSTAVLDSFLKEAYQIVGWFPALRKRIKVSRGVLLESIDYHTPFVPSSYSHTIPF